MGGQERDGDRMGGKERVGEGVGKEKWMERERGGRVGKGEDELSFGLY